MFRRESEGGLAAKLYISMLGQNAATTCVAQVVATTSRVNLATCLLFGGIPNLDVKGF